MDFLPRLFHQKKFFRVLGCLHVRRCVRRAPVEPVELVGTVKPVELVERFELVEHIELVELVANHSISQNSI